MIPTTQGLGPFYAKIIFDGFVYIHDTPYETETEAFQKALSVANSTTTKAAELIRENGFHG